MRFRYFAILTSRSARGHLIAAVGLALLLAGLVAGLTWRPPSEALRTPGLLQEVRRQADALAQLPASPSSDGRQPEPAPLLGTEAAQHNAAAPFAPLGSAAQPFHFAGTPEERMRARTCLAVAMLYEAGGDVTGQLAVAQVVLNRVRHPAFPGSVCGVVLQGSERSTGCQFTFTCDGALARRASPGELTKALAGADAMLQGFVLGRVGLATHYHTDEVYPWWSPRLEKIARVGPHLFFRWSGVWGSAKAMQGKRMTREPEPVLFAPLSLRSSAAGGPAAVPPRVEVQLAVRDIVHDPAPTALRGTDASASLSSPADAIPASRRLALAPAADAVLLPRFADPPALDGNRVLRTFPSEGVFYLELAPGSSEQGRRRAAQLLCGGRTACRVYGWTRAGQAPDGLALSPSAQATVAFTFVKEPVMNPGPALPGGLAF